MDGCVLGYTLFVREYSGYAHLLCIRSPGLRAASTGNSQSLLEGKHMRRCIYPGVGEGVGRVTTAWRCGERVRPNAGTGFYRTES